MVSMSVVLCVQVFDLFSDHVSLQELKFCLNLVVLEPLVVKSYKSNSVLLLVIRQEAFSENLACAESQDELWEGSADKTQGPTSGCNNLAGRLMGGEQLQCRGSPEEVHLAGLRA